MHSQLPREPCRSPRGEPSRGDRAPQARCPAGVMRGPAAVRKIFQHPPNVREGIFPPYDGQGVDVRVVSEPVGIGTLLAMGPAAERGSCDVGSARCRASKPRDPVLWLGDCDIG